MADSTPHPTLPHPTLGALLPRYLFLEPLVDGREVLEVGALADCRDEGVRFLLERGAKRVHAIDQGVETGAFDKKSGLRGATFENVGITGLHSQPFSLIVMHHADELLAAPNGLEKLKSLLAPGGHAVIVVRHEEGLALADLSDSSHAIGPSYSDLAELLPKHFTCVEVAVQAGFVGYSLTPYGVEDADVSVDWTLFDEGPATYYLFICGDAASGLNTQTLAIASAEPLRDIVKASRLDSGNVAEDMRAELEDALLQGRLEEAEKKYAAAETKLESAALEAAELERRLAHALAERDGLARQLSLIQAAHPDIVSPPKPAATKGVD